MKKVYLSFAYTTPAWLSEQAIEKLSEISEVEYYIKGSNYTDQPIKDCDVFAIILPSNSFSYEINKLSMGTKKELTQAYNLKKQIILVYYSQLADGVTFYLTNLDRGMIEGISGTNSDVIKLLKEEKIELGTADKISDFDWLNNNEEIIL